MVTSFGSIYYACKACAHTLYHAVHVCHRLRHTYLQYIYIYSYIHIYTVHQEIQKIQEDTKATFLILQFGG